MDLPTIPDIWARCKAVFEPLFSAWSLVILIFLVSLGSFGLGRFSALEAAKPAVSIGTTPEATEPRALTAGGLVVASKNGSVYHFPWCGGAKQINLANLVWFASEDAAEAAGYTPSKSCKGLVSE